MTAVVTTVIRRLRDAAERLGLFGLIGLGCALLALALALSAGRSLWQQRQALQAQAAAQGQRGPAPRGDAAADASAAAQLARFHAGFPPASAAAESLARLQAAARRAGLTLPSGEYRLEPRAGEPLQRYAVVLPLQGSYAQLRQFIALALAELPHAALDDVEMRRESPAGDAQLTARVRLTLYLRGDR
jgi:hypothetical protein